jgi:amino acid adenylation domain-containing protein
MPNDVSETVCVHEQFERQARRTPDAVALRYGGRGLSYQQLNTRANSLAYELRRRGVGPEALVGFCFGPSLKGIVATLGILKAGGAYLPLDPKSPGARLREIIHESRPVILVADSGTHTDLGELTGFEVIGLKARPSPDPEDWNNLVSGASPDNMAYVMYTSGSTGKPKGIVGIHRSLANGLDAAPFDRMGRDEVCSLNSPLNVGFSLSRVFAPLVAGRTLVVLRGEQSNDPELLVRTLEAERVTNASFVTPLFEQILTASPSLLSRLKRVRTITVGGAGLSLDLVNLCFRLLPQVRLIERYASSEIGCPAFYWEFERRPGGTCKRVGRPFPNTELYILDSELRPVSTETVGELYVAAPHLARGYVSQPILTAERFLADPFKCHHGGRMFRTGDRARRLEGGDFQVLGRSDDQVKVRGFRIELGEIERALQGHNSVREAAVILHPTGPNARLAAYVATKSGASIPVAVMRRHLKETLPEHMLPSSFSFLKILPRTRSGKIDRTALPSPTAVRPEISVDYSAPRNEAESTVARIWAEVLGLDRVGIHDNFFELGGDSLLTVHISSRIAEVSGLELPPGYTFRNPTVAEFARGLSKEIPH